jgi:hypothetical protein
MKTLKLAAGAIALLTLVVLTSALLSAAPTDTGNGTAAENTAPIIPRPFMKAHSEEWNDVYFDKYTYTQPKLNIPSEPIKIRGGMAEMYAQNGRPNAVPEPVKPVIKAHSEEWNSYYFDRTVNTRFVSPVTEYVLPWERRGGLAKNAMPQ